MAFFRLDVAGVAIAWGIIILAIQRFDLEFVSDLDNIWVSLGLLLIFGVILYAIKNDWLGSGSVVILAVVVAVEMFTSGLLNANSLDNDVVISSRTSYVSYVERFEDIFDRIKELDGSFYRMEKTSHRKTNDPFTFDFYGLSNSTSTLNAKQIRFLNDMGYSSKSHWSKYLGGTPVSDSLLGVKYVVFENGAERDHMELLISDPENNAYAFVNPYAQSVVYSAGSDVKTFESGEYYTPFEYMNALAGSMLGKGSEIELFRRLELLSTDTENLNNSFIAGHRKYEPVDTDETATVTYTVQNQPGKTIYCFFPSEYPRKVSLMANGKSCGTFFDNESDRIVELGRFDADEIQIRLTLEDKNLYISEKSDFYFGYIDDAEFESVFADLSKGNMNITEHSDTRLYGNIDVEEGQGVLFTTIPYDACWQVTVDGKRVGTYETCDALLAADITPGAHTVELKYVSAPFNNGCVVTAGSAIVFAVCVILADRARHRRNKLWREQGI